MLAVFRGSHTDVLAEDPVELGEAAEAAPQGCLRNGDLGVNEHGLHIAYPGHLDVVGDGKTSHILELMGKIAAAHIEFLS